MTKSKKTRRNEWNMRKQNQKPHGKVKSLAELSDVYGAEHSNQ